MRASVVIPSRGGAQRLPHLFDCLRAQTHTDWEAIVVLDGDIDSSAAVVAKATDIPVRAIVFGENRGRVAALNAGFAEATGDVLIRCDDDLRPRPDYLARHVANHAGDPVGVVGLYRNVLPDTPYARAYGVRADELFRRDAYATPEDRRWRYWAGNVSVTRATFDRIGPYDPAYRAYGWEDGDWGYRLAEAGIPVVLDPELETDHHVAATTTAIRALRAFHSGAARHLFESKHPEAHLPPADALDASLWNRAVGFLGRRWQPDSLGRASGGLDRLLPLLPPSIGRRLVGLVVESAGQAGYRNPGRTSNDI